MVDRSGRLLLHYTCLVTERVNPLHHTGLCTMYISCAHLGMSPELKSANGVLSRPMPWPCWYTGFGRRSSARHGAVGRTPLLRPGRRAGPRDAALALDLVSRYDLATSALFRPLTAGGTMAGVGDFMVGSGWITRTMSGDS